MRDHHDRYRSVLIFALCEFERCRAGGEQAAAAVVDVLHDPVALMVLSDKETVPGPRVRRGGF